MKRALVGLLWVGGCLSMGAQQAPLTVALTFDDLPAHGALPPGETRLQVVQSVLATLKNEKMPPVYGLVNAVRVEQAPETMEALRAWRAAGQPLGSHTYSHPNLSSLTVEAFEADIEKDEPVLKELAGDTDWHWFRYPFMNEGDTPEKRRAVRAYLREKGYKVADVTMDFHDYAWNGPYARCAAKKDEASIAELEKSYLAAADEGITNYRKISQQMNGRDIPYVMLMHIGAFDARMLPRLIVLLRSRGFSFTTLDKAESDPAYELAASPEKEPTFQQRVGSASGAYWAEVTKTLKALDAMCR